MREGTEIFIADMGELEDMHIAKEAGEVLETHYPGYLWIIEKSKCDIVVKNGALMKFGPYGFVPCCAKPATWSEFRKLVLQAGGELLERCGLPRSFKSWDGTPPQTMDGADPRKRRAFDYGDPIAVN